MNTTLHLNAPPADRRGVSCCADAVALSFLHMPNVCAVSKEDAELFLKDVAPLWRAFWFHMHLMARNIEEFGAGLATISDDVFAYHVSGQKNDLARWVREVIGDAELAKELDGVTTKEAATAAVRGRLTELHMAVGRA